MGCAPWYRNNNSFTAKKWAMLVHRKIVKGGGIVKHRKVSVAAFPAPMSPLTVMAPLAGVVVSLVGLLPAQDGALPFTERVISTTAVSARSVFATDMDGDGNIDVLSASSGDNKIAWYEWSPRGFDFDCDGDVDLDDFAGFQAAFTDPR